MSPLATAPKSVKGVFAMAVSMGLFVTNDTLLKLTMQELPLGETLGVRSAIAALVLAGIMVASGDARALPSAANGRVLLRSALDALTTFVYVAALAVMPIASSTTIYLAAPLITTAIAVPLLKEEVGWRRWCAIVVGFCGAMIVARPDPDTFQVVALLPLLAALFASVRDIGTRFIGMHIPGSVISLSSALVLGLGALAFLPFETWRTPSATALALLTAAGLAFSSANLLMVYAFRNAPVAAVSPMRYLLVFGALVSGYVIFGDRPDAWATIGMALVVGAGLYSIHRERVRARAAQNHPPLSDAPASDPSASGADSAAAPPARAA